MPLKVFGYLQLSCKYFSQEVPRAQRNHRESSREMSDSAESQPILERRGAETCQNDATRKEKHGRQTSVSKINLQLLHSKKSP